MLSVIKKPREFWSGAMFIFFGLAALIIAQQDYAMGTAGRMGPGYFPSVLGGILAVLGFISVTRSFFGQPEPLQGFAIKQTALILSAVFLFGFLVRGAGIVVAILVLSVVALSASSKFRLKSALIFGVGAGLFSAVVFAYLLGLPMPIIGPWLGAD